MVVEIIYGIIGGSGFTIAVLALGGAGFRRIFMRFRFRDVPPESPDQGGGYGRGMEGGRGQVLYPMLVKAIRSLNTAKRLP